MQLDDAYANAAYIENAEAFPPRWQKAAAEFRKPLPIGHIWPLVHWRAVMRLRWSAMIYVPMCGSLRSRGRSPAPSVKSRNGRKALWLW